MHTAFLKFFMSSIKPS